MARARGRRSYVRGRKSPSDRTCAEAGRRRGRGATARTAQPDYLVAEALPPSGIQLRLESRGLL